ncbi:MAG TPA: choice-of-anchor Q domain-containing protein [Rhodanobacteraceae bacterium]|nr:choice-of-anchor Q domain-containing protein [Rhodanobacteraceae bacterium]
MSSRPRYPSAAGTGSFAAGTHPARTALTTALLFALGISASAEAKVFFVTNASDSGPGSLRQSALDANAAGGHHKIMFSLPAGTTIGLTSGEIKFAGPDVTVQGPGRDKLTISGNHNSRIFEVQGNATLTVSSLTLRDGFAHGDDSNEADQRGGAIEVGIPNHDLSVPPPAEVPGLVLSDVDILASEAYSPTDGGGGAVFMQDGRLTVDHCLMDGNFARRAGGAIHTRRGTVVISDSQFTNNTVDFSSAWGENEAQGGGIEFNESKGEIHRSVIRDNELTGPSDGSGGGRGAGFTAFTRREPVLIDSSEISDNRSTQMPFSIGGGVACNEGEDGSAPTLTIVNSTISGNVGNYGVGLEAGCNVALLNSTIAYNTTTNYYGDGGRPGIEAYSPRATEQTRLTIVSSLVSGNLGGGSDLGFYHLEGNADPAFVGSNSLVQSPESNVTLPSDTLVGIDPLLGPLASNGAATRTQALLPGSPAIDAGSNPLQQNFDQRGLSFPRTFGPATDIGAYESSRRSNGPK